DGRDDRGVAMPPGRYRIDAIANVGGRAESVPVSLRQRIDGVSVDARSGTLRLNTAHGTLALSDVRQIL
ncbi:MAG: flagellar biosynthesis protein FlgD, partial [Gammaproteobacteria bacterium]|nr:flagellar biosynthesis protein FlgD [Gammaproteobacteria bacterium]